MNPQAKYKVEFIEDTNEWENFLKETDPNIFVQSEKYGDFFRAMGEEAFILGVRENAPNPQNAPDPQNPATTQNFTNAPNFPKGKLIAGSLVVTTTARRGRFLYLPYGPKLDFNNQELWATFAGELKKIARIFKADFVRVSPFADDTPQLAEAFKKVGFRSAPMHVLAETTWILDLTPSEEELFKAMRSTTRNLIHRGEREGVEIRISEDDSALKRLNDLLQETALRHKFVPFSFKYMKSEFDAFKIHQQGHSHSHSHDDPAHSHQPPHSAKVFEAYFEGKLASSAVIFFYGDTAVYRHGASSSERIKCQPSYLLQWRAIQEAKKLGLKYYNFWGIAPQDAPKHHPFAGITTFKTGFGGFQKDLLHCHDLPVTPKYWFNWLIETIRRIKRGF